MIRSELDSLQKLRAALQRVRSSEGERELLQRQYSRVLEDAAAARAELDALKGSRAYRLARTLADTLHQPKLLLQWPGMILAIAKRRLPGAGGAETLPSAPQASTEPGLIALHPKPRIAVTPVRDMPEHIEQLPQCDALPEDVTQFRIAVICDAFTAQNLAPECGTLFLRPDGWAEQIRGFRPHFLLVESAWVGLDGEWEGKVFSASEELRSLVASCRSAGIPTVFWNKEDPLHFEAFVDTAALFDHVFTTDADSIPNYVEKLGHGRVGVLPFAVQPRLHHPFAQADEARLEASFFAGAWYGNLEERCRDFVELADVLSLAGPFHIYDRNGGTADKARHYPLRFREHLRPAVGYEQTPALYRGYRIGLSLNTIKQSSTMFARRALELMCTNTSVYSNHSRALKLMFGDLVNVTDDGAAMLEAAWHELRDPDASVHRRRRLHAMRKVLAEHTWAARLRTLAATLSGDVSYSPRMRVTVLCHLADARQASRIALMAENQRDVDVALYAMCDEGLSLPACMTRLDEVVLASSVATNFAGELVALWSAADSYGPNYLGDLAANLQFAQGAIIGKACFVRMLENGRHEVVGIGSDYRLVERLAWKRSLAEAQFWPGTIRALLEGVEEGMFQNAGLLSADRESYFEGSVPEEYCWNPKGLDVGIPLKDLQQSVHRLVGDGAAAESPVIEGQALADIFDKHKLPEGTSIAAKNGVMEMVSRLPQGREEAIFSNTFSADSLHQGRSLTQIRLMAEPSSSYEAYLDAMGSEPGVAIGRIRLFPGTTHALAADQEVLGYRLAIGIRGAYVGYWRGLAVGDGLPAPLLLPGGDRVLVVVNGYPSHDDLYRNAFVHRRVKLYREQGIGVDVVWVSSQRQRISYTFEDVCVQVCDAATLRASLRCSRYSSIAVHFLDEELWGAVEEAVLESRVVVWVHGAEVQSWSRRAYNYSSPEQLAQAQRQSDARIAFWRGILCDPPEKLRLVFVSATLAEQAWQDIGLQLGADRWTVIHNPIDVLHFRHETKAAEQRWNVLSIRPHASRGYANDLVAAAIHDLASAPEFAQMTFTLVGDGELWEENFSTLRDFPNVRLCREFVGWQEIRDLHARNGIFLVPSRGDTQGVSRDEAMASGLVPVTNPAGAIPEFVDQDSAVLCAAEQPGELAAACLQLVRSPELFQRLSAGAAARVRAQSSSGQMVSKELAALGF